MKMLHSSAVFGLLLAALPTSVQAHFLFLRVKPAENGPRAEVMFSESPEPDDPDLLEKIAGVKVWHQEGRDGFKSVAVEKAGDVLVTPTSKSSVFALSQPYGVIERGGEAFLLHYHAKTYSSPLSGEWRAIAKDEQIPFEITPKKVGDKIELTVTWQGKPAADAQIVVGGAGIDKLDVKTEAQGKITVEPKANGLLFARAKHVEQAPGKEGDNAYATVRHWTTLTVPVTLPTLRSVEHSLQPIGEGVTSFGAAVIGDELFLFGGHLGGAHHYWKDGQSPDLQKLDLKSGKWEKVAKGNRRTGTAMVAYNGKLIRIGGFEARNAEQDEADLHSMNDVEAFDPKTKTWSELPALPEPRSSHDAALIGDKLYVVGGWDLQKRGEGQFHDTMSVLDLSAKEPKWTDVKTPFKRRALSAAARNGRLYVLGGMQEKGGPSTEVDVYDPQSDSWTKGPALFGPPLEGFGSTAFEIGGKLLVVTRSGAVQQLADDGKSWHIAGQVKHPRFFARLLPIADHRAILIGGADMESGKTLEVEVLARE